ncbi:MAG: NAD-dependent succinate-semialdehyde dehydrogenase [Halobacteria archaeon]
MKSINPATEELIRDYDQLDWSELDEKLETADERFEEWREQSLDHRQSLMREAADVLEENEDEYAETMTREMGKPIAESRSEVEKCAWVCRYYSENAREHLQDRQIATMPDAETYVKYQPLGVVFAIMPWNYPFWQVFRFAAPSLTAGNVGVLSHAPNVPGCAEAIEDVFEEAGFPEGAFTNLFIDNETSADVISDDRVKAVTLTGSERAGRAVASQAGENLKKTVLELGGSDPFVVLDDADVEFAAEQAVKSRTLNSGQSCIAAKRMIVHEDVYDEFLELFVEKMEELEVGDPEMETVDIGPQAREDLMEDLHDQVERSVEEGAKVLVGGEPLDRDGYFYPPTVLTDVQEDAAARCEEVFGPVAPVIEVEDEDEALEVANGVELGLGASVYTGDRERGRRFAEAFEAGAGFVNQFVKSDPRVPFGGIKKSGYGRELSSEGIREFVNRKTVWIQTEE